MKKTYTLLMLLSPLLIQAQITVTGNDLPFPLLAFTMVHDTAYHSPMTPGGANQVWNYISLQNTMQDTLAFIPASSTPFTAQFPNANLASYDVPNNSYSYFISNNTGFYLNGGTNNITTGGNVVYNPPLTFIPVPFTYHSTHSDYARFQIDSTGGPYPLRFIHQIQNTFLGDGYGSLQLPNATYPNTLRVKLVENTSDSILADIFSNGNYVLILPPTVNQVVHYRWFRNGTAAYLLGVDADSAGAIATRAEYLLNYVVGISQLSASNVSLQIFPNPAFDKTQVILPSAIHAALLKITDAQGKIVDEVSFKEKDVWLDVKHYDAGWYLLSIDNESVHYQAKLLVKKDGE